MDAENVFQSNAAELRELHDAITITFKRRQGGPEPRRAWQEACRRFHEGFDSLAFPGGLGRAWSLLRSGDPGTIEMVTQLLEADPYFFRSGYLKEDFIKQLCRMHLSEDQKKRLQQVVLARIQDRDRREFRRFCRLARAVADPAFKEQVTDLMGSDRVTSRHARWVLEYLNTSTAKPKRRRDN
ncbi:MAG TPA: hypothetical protein VGU64_05275 [Terriglobales bacterium]|nr:hypothetical protein [Terriglobales bacterium]